MTMTVSFTVVVVRNVVVVVVSSKTPEDNSNTATAQKSKFFIKNFSSKCGFGRKLRIWSHLLVNPQCKTSFFVQFITTDSQVIKKVLRKCNSTRLLLAGQAQVGSQSNYGKILRKIKPLDLDRKLCI